MWWGGKLRALALLGGLALATAALVGCEDITAVQRDGTFLLQVGDRADAGDFSVRFVSVPNDSRCPSVCPTEGDAIVRLYVRSSGYTSTVDLHTNSTHGPVSYEQDGHVIELLEVTPWPDYPGDIEQWEYTVQLRLSHI